LGEEIATSAHPLTPRGRRARGAAIALIAIIASGASACGDDAERQDADETAGDFPVEVTAAEFPPDQRLAQTTDLELGIENAGDEDVPDLAVTIFTGDKPSSGSFSVRSEQPGLADPNRPVWILENGFPKLVTRPVKDLETAPPAGAEAAQTNTFSFGPLAPGESKDIVWRLTPVQAGSYTVHYELAAGLSGKAKAVTRDGGPVEGEFVVTITDKPPQARINSAGEVEIE